MSGGELMALQAVASVGSKLFSGGSAQAAPAAAAPPTPFDTIVQGVPGGEQAPPPMPGRNSLFSGAALTPDETPLPTKNPLFHSPQGAAPAAAQGMAMPTKNPLFHDQAGGMGEAARGMFSPKPAGPDIMAELADKPLRGGQDMPKPSGGAKPIDNNQRTLDQGWDVETVYGTELQSGSQGAPYGDLTEVPKNRAGVTDAAKPKPSVLPPVEASSEAPFQASTPMATPKLDDPVFDTAAPSKPGAQNKQGGLFGITIPGVGEVNQALRKTPTNPLFQVGMGLLSSGYDGSNPFTQMNQGIGKIPGLEIAGNQDKRAQSTADEKASEAAELREIMALLAGKTASDDGEDEDKPKSRVARQAAKVVR
jgi:hypothetical protein